MSRLALATVLATVLVLTASAAVAAGTPAPKAAARDASYGFVVVAPDRGFQGNEEARDAFEALADAHPARLVFVADDRSRPYLQRAVAELRAGGARHLVILPLFVSPSHPRLALARRLADDVAPEASWGRPYGASFLAVEALADRLRQAEHRAGSPLLVVASGAADPDSRRAMTAEVQRLAVHAAAGLGFARVTALVAPASGEKRPDLQEAFDSELAAAAVEGSLVVPFDQGAELDGMMAFTGWLRRKLPEGVAYHSGDITPDPLVALWLRREANRHLPIAPERLGVVALAHGSDFYWNETMRRAVESLEGRYLVEPSFSMADRALMERAIRRLEDRGAQAVVVVRIFGMEGSFRGSVERMLGLDVEGADGLVAPGHEHHGSGQGHGHGHGGGPPQRIRTTLPVATAGGLEDHPLFARALLDRARQLSEESTHEVVLLVAHGSGDDGQNAHWQEVLDSIADQMKRAAGDAFAAIETVTWREDWPDKREPSVARAREIVESAVAAGRRVIVIPARTTGRGPADELLAGLDYVLGEGFAPHPLFTDWLEEQVIEGAGRLAIEPGPEKLVTALDKRKPAEAWPAPTSRSR